MGYLFFNQLMNTFPKKEHLCGDINITRLHELGKAFMSFPFRVVYFVTDNKDPVPVRVMVSVPKKRFKHAVERNRIKRLTREVYRLNKQEIIDYALGQNLKLYISFQYVSNEVEKYELLERKMKNALRKLIQNLSVPNQTDENSN